MVDRAKKGGDLRGPGSRPMAAVLVELLTQRDRLGDCERVSRVITSHFDSLPSAPKWLGDDVVDELLRAGSVDALFARSLGHRLVSPDSMGMPLYALGLATPEKAYRRLQALLPRASSQAKWCADTIADAAATLEYHPGFERESPQSILEAECALRQGMLESIPTLYGLLPATVKELQCAARGASHCRYQVHWRRTQRMGSAVGAAVGISAVGAAMGWLFGAAAGAEPMVWCYAVLVGLLGGLAGRGFDLAAQLEAVAGARRGQLALFDQVDDQLASKLDALARADSKLESEEESFRVRTGAGDRTDGGAMSCEQADLVRTSAEQIHRAAGDLGCRLDEMSEHVKKRGKPPIAAAESLVREVREAATRLHETLGGQSMSRSQVELASLVDRAVMSLRPEFGTELSIDLDFDLDAPTVECESIQIEEVVVQLLKNAVQASRSVGARPEATVQVARSRDGVEIAISDSGAGIEPGEIDQAFDPFFSQEPVGAVSDFGLPVCLRIIEAHGGELRIEAGERAGTRVTIFLPDPEKERNGDA